MGVLAGFGVIVASVVLLMGSVASAQAVAAGAPGATSATIMVETLDDGLVEPDETLTLTLSNPINAVLGTSSSAVGAVISPGVIVEPTVLHVTEGRSATFTQVLKTQPTGTVFLFPPAAGVSRCR